MPRAGWGFWANAGPAEPRPRCSVPSPGHGPPSRSLDRAKEQIQLCLGDFRASLLPPGCVGHIHRCWICSLCNAQVNGVCTMLWVADKAEFPNSHRSPGAAAAPWVLHSPCLGLCLYSWLPSLYFPHVISKWNKMEFLWHRVFPLTFQLSISCSHAIEGILELFCCLDCRGLSC